METDHWQLHSKVAVLRSESRLSSQKLSGTCFKKFSIGFYWQKNVFNTFQWNSVIWSRLKAVIICNIETEFHLQAGHKLRLIISRVIHTNFSTKKFNFFLLLRRNLQSSVSSTAAALVSNQESIGAVNLLIVSYNWDFGICSRAVDLCFSKSTELSSLGYVFKNEAGC